MSTTETKTRLLYEDVIDQIKASKYLSDREKQAAIDEINTMLEKKQIKTVPSELSSGIRGNLGVIFTWATSPSGYHYWKRINTLI